MRWSAGWALGLLSLICAAHSQLTEPPCPGYSYFGENFYQGATILSNGTQPDAAACCSACSADLRCYIWTYCPAMEAGGCLAPAGPFANVTFPAGTCLQSAPFTLHNEDTRLRWSFMETGVPWVAGEFEQEDPAFVGEAGSYTENWERIFSTGGYFCRTVTGGDGQLLAVNVSNPQASSTVSMGQQVVYSGLTVNVTTSGAELAILFFNDTKTIWAYPAEHLAYCEAPSCPPNSAGSNATSGRSEQGASCKTDADCCVGMRCRPRAVSDVLLFYNPESNPNSTVLASQRFSLDDPTFVRRVLPRECAVLETAPPPLPEAAPAPGPAEDSTGPIFEFPRYKGVPVSYCRDLNARCGYDAAAYFCSAVARTPEGGNYTTAAAIGEQVPVTGGDTRTLGTVAPEYGLGCSPAFQNCSTFSSITCQ